MLYKVTPMMPAPEGEKVRKPKDPGQPRKRRKTAIYDAEGNEVLITLMCLKCKSMKPLAMFGLRKMADGAIRNQPWCRTCRGATTAKKKPVHEEAVESSAPAGEGTAEASVADAVSAAVAEAEAVAEAAAIVAVSPSFADPAAEREEEPTQPSSVDAALMELLPDPA